MPGKGCKQHTPIVSERQRRFFGAELARKRAGKKTKTGMSEAVLRAHLREGIKRKPHGSGPFTAADIKRGYKIIES